MNNSDLPPILGSDDQTLKWDRYDSYYKKRPSEVWTGKVEKISVKEHIKCEHYFVPEVRGVRCRKCQIGLTGDELVIVDGQLFFRDQKLF